MPRERSQKDDWMRFKRAFVQVLLLFVACNDSGTGPQPDTGIPDQAKTYADSHWEPAKFMDDRVNPSEASWYGYWKGWYEENAIGQDIDDIMECELPVTLTDEYYRMIGECDQLIYGWDDVHNHLYPGDSCLAPQADVITWTDTLHFEPCIYNVESPHRDEYLLLLDENRY